jgi:outer membrane lipopolysaccharide assembly protein LptE/RlpB
MTLTIRVFWLACLAAVAYLSGCSYSFTGVALEPDERTVLVRRFDDVGNTGRPALAQEFTEALRDRFIRQSALKIVGSDADLEFRGQIIRYEVAPITITGNEQAAQNRLTMAVEVEYINHRHPRKNWKQSFEQFSDFSSTQSLASVESGLVADLTERLTQDIFNKALANW